MKHLKFLPLFLFLIFQSSSSFSQDTLTLQQAVAMALENNYSIRLAKQDVRIAETNNSIANAGFLPTLDATGAHDNSITNTFQQRIDGGVRELSGARSNSLSGSILMNWTVFEGLNMFIAKSSLEKLQTVEEIEARLAIENTVSSVVITYYDIVSETMKMKALLDAVSLSRERRQLAEFRMEIGSSSQSDVYQALVDYNADTASLIQQYNVLRTLKSSLNTLLARSPETDFSVTDTISDVKKLNYEELKEKVSGNNTQLYLARQNVELAHLNNRYWKTQYFPSISLYGGYSYLNSQSEAGIFLVNKNQGPIYGITGTYNLFNGFNNRRNRANARIQLESGKIQEEQTALNINNDLYQYWLDYQANIDLAELESSNLETAKFNLDLAVQMFRLGSISNIELRDIQIKYINAQTRQAQALFTVKAAETELLRLAGELGRI